MSIMESKYKLVRILTIFLFFLIKAIEVMENVCKCTFENFYMSEAENQFFLSGLKVLKYLAFRVFIGS